MDEERAVAAARGAVEAALRAGATSAESTASIGRRFSAEARAAAITKLEQSTAKNLHVRVYVGGRKATVTSADFEGAAVRAAVERAVALAANVDDDPLAGLPSETARDVPDLQLCDPDLVKRSDEAGADDALAIERAIREADARVTNSNGSHYASAFATVAHANSAGFSGVYTATRAGRSTSPVAPDGPRKRTAHYGAASRRLRDLEANESVGHTGARRAVDMFGARKPATMRVPVIFERDVAAAVLGDVFAALSAANVALDNSWLADRVGDRVGSELVTLIDDGRMPGLLGSSPFDGEGVATRRTVAIERGTLATFLYDGYHARKLGAKTTGNASGGSVGPNTFYLEPGTQSLDRLIASTPRGVLVLDTIGFATEHASGSYSRGARGFFIENGELAYPIEEFTIAASLPEMLAGIDAVACDLRFDASVVSPSFRVAEMTVSGN